MKPKFNLFGTINWNCEYCLKQKKCLYFEVDNLTHKMCEDCSSKIYGYKAKNKKPKKNNNEYCNVCKDLTMTHEHHNDVVKDDEVIQYYICKICGRVKKHNIQTWKKNIEVSEL